MIRPRHRTEPHTGTCSVCERLVYWPAVQPHLPAEVRSLCADCYPGAFLALHLDVLEVLVCHPESEAAWSYVAPVLFDNVRGGWPEPGDLDEFIGWLFEQQRRQTRLLVTLHRALDDTVRYDLPRQIATLIEALTGHLAG